MKALDLTVHAMELCMYNEGFGLCMYNEGFGLIQCHGTLHV